MEKSDYQRVEGKLYNYYKYKNEIGKLKSVMENLEKHIEDIEHRIRNAHKYITLDTDLPCIGVGERVQTSSDGISYFERELEREVTKLQREKLDKIKRLYKMDGRIRNMESLICEMDYTISLMDPEDKKFIELKYKYKKSLSYIAMEMSFSNSTAARKKDNIISQLLV